MITALLTLALGAGHVPAPAVIPPALAQSDVRVSVEMTSTHFAAESFAPMKQWLVFENPSIGLKVAQGIAPFSRLVYPIEDGASEGMTVQLVTKGPSGITLFTGSLDVSALIGAPVFIQHRSESFTGWIPRHGGRSLTRAHFAPANQLATAPHVPVPLPSENKTRDKSRRIEKKKLPPI